MHPSIEFSFANFHFAMEKTKKLNNHKAIQLENRKDIKQKNNRKLAFQKTFFSSLAFQTSYQTKRL